MLWTPPASSIDWAGSVMTPAFLAAIAAGQADVETVGKSAKNTDQNYSYAPADALVEEIRSSFAPHGVAFVSSWRTFERPWRSVSKKTLQNGEEIVTQWLDFHVVLDWALLFGDTDANVACRLVGTADLVAIGSAGRPPDKSVLAARTEIAGAVALGLGALDRAKVADTVGDRTGDDAAGPGDARARRKVLTTAAKDRMAGAIRQLAAARKAAGHRINGKPPEVLGVRDELVGPDYVVDDDASADHVTELAMAAFAKVRASLGDTGAA